MNTDLDRETCRAAHARLEAADLAEEYDGPETVMLSNGYADVWLDGDVTQFRCVVFNVLD